jgi:5'-nucleotidase
LNDRRHLLPGLAAFVAALLVALIGLYASAEAPRPGGVVKLRLLGVNDFHGHLEPPQPGLGGAAWLKAHLDRAELPGRTIRVHAGDMVGASPLASSWFHDEPSIQVANEIGFDVGTVGNHEFDEGGEELLRLLRGGRRSGPDAFKRDADGRLVNTSAPGFEGARFPYLAANTVDRDGRLFLPPFLVVERAGARVGFIGVTTESTPHFLLARHSERFRFTDISGAVNRWVPELRRRGVEAIVVLAHAGGPEHTGWDAGTATGEIVEETRQMDDAVDVVIAGHSHSHLNLRVPNRDGGGHKLIVEALSYGVAYDRVDIAVSRRTGDVVRKTGAVPATEHAGTPADPPVAELVEGYVRRVSPLADRVVGDTPVPLTKGGGELAQLTAEAQRAHTGSDVGIVNPGSLRADIDAGPITYGEVFEALAYDHPLIRMRLTGERIASLIAKGGGRLAVAGPDGSLEPNATYMVVANELLVSSRAFPPVDPAPSAGTEVEALAGYLSR